MEIVAVSPGDRIVTSGFDRQIALLSLPFVLHQPHPWHPVDPYLRAEPSRRADWQDRLAAHTRLRIGLVWTGSPIQPNNAQRSIGLEKLTPLLRMPNAEFFSLQLQSNTPSPSPVVAGLINLTGHISDFADTAALMAELDLIITVDTATAHLAGALGRPVWTLLPFVADWRWGLDREGTPWYPTMRLFRQKTAGDWEEVIERVAEALRAHAAHCEVCRP
jgi:hypothetical protein